MQAQVLIVGAGPVGLSLALDLGHRGVRCVLVEQKAEPQFLPKMERCNARTMEMYRRIGVAEPIRAAGLSADTPMDVFVIRSMTEQPILRLPYPSVDDARRRIRDANDGNMALEPYQLISQYTLEPVLKALAERLTTVEVRYGTSFSNSPRTGRVYLQPCAGPMERLKKYVALIWSDATGAAAASESNLGSDCAAKPISPRFARAFIAAKPCSAGCRSATAPGTAGTTWPPTIIQVS
jgi:FAD binding domain-containing protein